MKTNNSLFIPLFLILFSSNFVCLAQNRANYNYGNSEAANSIYGTEKNPSQVLPVATILNNNMLELEATVLMNVTADEYVAMFHIEQKGERLKDVQENMDKRIANFQKGLLELGIKEGEMIVDFLSLVPEYEYDIEKKLFSKTYNEVPVGFELKKNVHIRFKDNKMVDKIIAKAAENEIYDLSKVEYFIKDTDILYQKLRKKAFELITKKEKLYDSAKIQISKAEKVADENFQTFFPFDRYRSYEAVSKGKTSFSKNSKVNDKNRTPSAFYEKLEYDNIECIINPTILEPAVQLFFTLKIRYTLPREEKDDKIIYILTPTGELRRVDLKE
ncbi:SIMPL domain-containing protein [Bernardetia sp. OM2101]|uniref:SIMPL domain-containing protein n=1 Tax=Bernardetia sp. OM2101 TaxID=3344876 RepID=UPI0035CFB628